MAIAYLQKMQQIVPIHFRVRVIHQRKISLSLSLSHLAIERSKFPPLLTVFDLSKKQ